jgi:hypothetical protein
MRRLAMSKVLVGIFTVVFVGALAYEMFNRTKPDLVEKFEIRCSKGLDSFLSTSEAAA